MGYKVKNKQAIIQILILNTAFYIYGNIRLKEINIMKSFEKIQENTISGSAVAFIPDPLFPVGYESHGRAAEPSRKSRA